MTKTFADQVRDTEARHVLQTYKRAPIVLVRGQGARVWDTEGKDYLDFTSGVGVASLGHANPGLARVIAEQASTLVHTSNLFFHPYQAELSEKLARLSGLDRAFFCNSGTEAMEACLKFARRYWYTKGDRQRTGFVALTRAFHGRTFGSLSMTADPHYREPFEPLVPGVTFVDPADPAALDAGGDRRDGGHRRRADSRRRRRASAVGGVCRGHPGRGRADRHAASSPTKCRAASAARATRSTRRSSASIPI